MTANQYRTALGKLGLSIFSAGAVFGLAGRQSQRFAAGDAPVPELVAKVLKLLVDGKLTLADLESK